MRFLQRTFAGTELSMKSFEALEKNRQSLEAQQLAGAAIAVAGLEGFECASDRQKLSKCISILKRSSRPALTEVLNNF